MRIASLVLAAFAGFIGGAVGSHLTSVYAQGPDAGLEALHSKDFVLLDGSGHKRGEWNLDASGQPVLRLFDARGRIIWEAEKRGVQLLHQP